MKKTIFCIAIILTLSNLLFSQIQMDSNGNVGIGIAPSSSYRFYVNGTTRLNGSVGIGTAPNSQFTLNAGTTQLEYLTINSGYARIWTEGYYSKNLVAHNGCNIGSSTYRFSTVYCNVLNEGSDGKYKENITLYENALDKIMKLNAVKYDLKLNYLISQDIINKVEGSSYLEKVNKERKNHIGYIAQDVYNVLPEVVYIDDSTGEYSITYTRIIPVLAEAIKEQHIIIQSLQKEIQELKNNSGNSTKLKSATTTSTLPFEENIMNALYQNVPNPFSQSTTIEYSLAENVQKAMICIYDMNGAQLKCIPLHLTGYGNITINGSELKSGMYMYSLIADGQLIDTKRMILTD